MLCKKANVAVRGKTKFSKDLNLPNVVSYSPIKRLVKARTVNAKKTQIERKDKLKIKNTFTSVMAPGTQTSKLNFNYS